MMSESERPEPSPAGPPDPTPDDHLNPYISPAGAHSERSANEHSSDSPSAMGAVGWVTGLFVLPLVVAHACFWPVFGIVFAIRDHNDYGIVSGLSGLAASAIAGLGYGILLARFATRRSHGRDWRDHAAIRSQFRTLAVCLSIAQLFYFPASVFGGCISVAFLVNG